MNPRIVKHGLRVGLLGLAPLLISQAAHAIGTTAGDTVSNLATINYSVGGVPQNAIGSSPTGNTTGAGTATTFVVDNKVNLNVIETGNGATTTTPGAPNVVTTFKVTNIGNSPQGYALAPTTVAGITMTNLRTAVSTAACTVATTTTPAYAAEPATTFINTLANDACVYVFILADTPLAATNGQTGDVRLTATVATPGSSGATLVTENPTVADTAGTVDIVFANPSAQVPSRPTNASEFANDQYIVNAPSLTVTKASAVISDPFNNTTNPKAIPGATIEYTLTVANASGAAADAVVITDNFLATSNTTLANGGYGGGANDIQLQTGVGAPTTCTAAADADACTVAAGVLTVNLGTVATGAANNRIVRFRVTIN